MSIIGNEVPNGKILFKSYNLNEEKQEKELKSRIESHWFNQRLELILSIKNKDNDDTDKNKKGSLLSKGAISNTLNVESEIVSFFNPSAPSCKLSNTFYQIETTLDVLLDHSFLNEYIKPGGFHAISQLNFIDSGNVVGILPNGKIVLNVDKDTYEQLGLVGKPSVFRNQQKYVITLDTNDKSFQKDSKSYNRIIWALRDRISSVCLIVYLIRDNKLVPIKFPENVKVKEILNNSEQNTKSFRVPNMNHFSQLLFNNNQKEDQPILSKDDKCDLLLQWNEMIGMLSLGIEIGSEENDVEDWSLNVNPLYIDSKITDCFIGSLTGFISNQMVFDFIEKIKMFIEKDWIEWGCINIYGFSDTPISWGSFEHGYLYGGENDHSIVIHSGKTCWSSSIIGANDLYSF
eukprot:gene7599-9343_t